MKPLLRHIVMPLPGMLSFLVLVFLFSGIDCAVAGLLQQEVIISQDETYIFTDSQRHLLSGAGDKQTQNGKTIQQKIADGEIVTKIIDIKNIQGHNPLNPQNPVLNFDEIVYDTPTELKKKKDNGSYPSSCKYNPAFIYGCGASRTSGITTSAGIFLFQDSVGNCEIKPYTAVYLPVPVTPVGMIVAFSIKNPVVGSQSSNTVLFSTTIGAGFTLLAPPAGATALTASSWAVLPGLYFLTLRHDSTGSQWRYQLEITAELPVKEDPVNHDFYNFSRVGLHMLSRETL